MIDFQKAFDYVVHNNVWTKLIQSGVTGKILGIVQSMYRQLRNRIRNFDGTMSEPFDGVIGLRQGESLSPLLFSLSEERSGEQGSEVGIGGIVLNNVRRRPMYIRRLA